MTKTVFHIKKDIVKVITPLGYELTNVWSCNNFAMTKANPQIYKKAAEKIGVPVDKILFLDDNYNACKTAKEAGMGVCGVYDESSKEYAEDIKDIADYYICRLNELLEL